MRLACILLLGLTAMGAAPSCPPAHPPPTRAHARARANARANARDHPHAGRFSDITVTAFGQPFALHRILLAANPYFHALLHPQHAWAEANTPHLHLRLHEDPWMSLDAFRLLLARLYGRLEEGGSSSSSSSITEDNVLALLVTALYFGDMGLGEQCIEFLAASVNAGNVGRYLAFADSSFYGMLLGVCVCEVCCVFVPLGSLPCPLFLGTP
jgi:hypothetical protein